MFPGLQRSSRRWSQIHPDFEDARQHRRCGDRASHRRRRRQQRQYPQYRQHRRWWRCRTEGRVTAVEVSVKVSYPNLCKIVFTGTAIFRHQIQIKPGTFSAAGDSGSLVVTTGSCPGAVGLLFAGGAHSTFANPMTAVLRKFNATMVGNSCKPTKTLLADASASAMDYRQQPQPSEMAVTVAVKQRHEAELLKMSGVTGSGVGLSAEGKAVIKVFVEKDTQAMRSSVPPFLETIPVE